MGLKQTRKLDSGLETYDYEIKGNCTCGEPVIKVIGSNRTCWKNGERFYTPGDKRAVCNFRCRKCNEVVHENFHPIDE